MNYSLIKRDPNIGYIDNWLWLPKKQLNLGIVKRGLTVPILVDGELDSLKLWRNTKHHLGIPRAQLDPNELDYEVVDLRPRTFLSVDIQSRIVLDQQRPELDRQQKAFNDFYNSPGGILNLSCGMGKSIVALHAIAKWGEPALVICNTTALMEQWRQEIAKFLKVDSVGLVQGNPSKWDWKHPITIASLKTLAIYHNQVPIDMLLWFNRIIWDEVHHVSSREFSKTASLFPGHRYGASATTERADGMEFVYYWHIGKEVHINLEQDITPTVLFLKSRTVVDLSHKDATDKNGQVHNLKLISYVGQLERELDFAKALVNEGLEKGRDIVAISMSKDHVQRLHEITPGSGVLHSDVKSTEERLSMLNDHKITYGTVSMLSEALNKKTLDSLIILSEFKSRKNAQQSTGRIQRLLMDREKKAKVIVIFHVNVPPLRRMGFQLMKYFKRCGFKVQIK